MHAKFTIVALALTSLVLVTIASACTSSPGSGDASGCGKVNWSEFTPMQGQGLKDSSLQELEDSVPFHFVLPSCLPEGLSKTFLLSTQAVVNQNQASLFLMGTGDSEVSRIRIEERASTPGGFIPVGDTQTISGITVDCGTTPHGLGGDTSTTGTMFGCDWAKDSVDFEVEFLWPVGTSKPEDVTPDMKRQINDVILSMIDQ